MCWWAHPENSPRTGLQSPFSTHNYKIFHYKNFRGIKIEKKFVLFSLAHYYSWNLFTSSKNSSRSFGKHDWMLLIELLLVNFTFYYEFEEVKHTFSVLLWGIMSGNYRVLWQGKLWVTIGVIITIYPPGYQHFTNLQPLTMPITHCSCSYSCQVRFSYQLLMWLSICQSTYFLIITFSK